MKFNNSILNSEASITVNEMLDIEKVHKFKFPLEFKEFYLLYNGGELEKYVYVKDGKEHVFNNFYPIKYTDFCMEKMLGLCDLDNTPKHLIPFATDPGGDEFCFSIKKGEEGKIYYLAHEFYERSNPRKGTRLLANNLIEFINGMVDEES